MVTTDNCGFYVAENLPIGPYGIEVDQLGFKRSLQSGFFVVADGRVTADFSLQVGDTSQTVEVVAAQARAVHGRGQAPSVTITSTSFGTVTAAHPSRAIQLGMKLQF